MAGSGGFTATSCAYIQDSSLQLVMEALRYECLQCFSRYSSSIILANAYQEADTFTVNLPDDDPKIVDLVLHFLYKLDYDDTIAITTSQEEEINHDSMDTDIAAHPITTSAPDNASSSSSLHTEIPELDMFKRKTLSSHEACFLLSLSIIPANPKVAYRFTAVYSLMCTFTP